MVKIKKKGLTPVIATILLILMSVAALVTIAGFLIPWVKDKLSETECVKTLDLIKIVDDEEFNCIETSGNARVMIERGYAEELIIKGIAISLEGDTNSKVYRIYGGALAGVSMFDGVTLVTELEIPGEGEIRTYVFDKTALGIDFDIKKANAAVLLNNDKMCQAVEAKLPACGA